MPFQETETAFFIPPKNVILKKIFGIWSSFAEAPADKYLEFGAFQRCLFKPLFYLVEL